MSDHTPTPWKLTIVGGSYCATHYVEGANSEVIAIIDRDVDEPTNKANAAFIVQACNSHDELVAATKELLSIARMYHKGEAPGHEDACECPDNCGHCLAVRRVVAAIKTATP